MCFRNFFCFMCFITVFRGFPCGLVYLLLALELLVNQLFRMLESNIDNFKLITHEKKDLI